jgi:ABC-2 type transport system permease protein
MQNILTIYRKELKSYFNSPIAYIVIIVFLAISGWFFVNGFFPNDAATMRPLFDMVPFVFLFFIPAITMRSFSEEKKQGTIELLLTKPVKDVELVIGKYLAALMLTIITLLPTIIYLLVVVNLSLKAENSLFSGGTGLFLLLLFFAIVIGSYVIADNMNKQGKLTLSYVMYVVSVLITIGFFVIIFKASYMDWGSVVGGYLGLILMAAIYIGIGIFTSSLTENQVVSFIVSFIIVFALFMMGKILVQVSPGLVSIVEYVSTDYHFTNISRGVIDSRNIIYYLSMIFLTVFITKVSIESRKW